MSPLQDLFCGCSLPSRCHVTSIKIMGDAPVVPQVPAAAAAPDIGAVMKPGVSAMSYAATPDDSTDVLLAAQFQALDRKFASTLKVRRISPGEYVIDGRRVKLAADNSKDITVREMDVYGSMEEPMPLAQFFQQVKDVVAYVDASLGGKSPGSPTVARVPADKRLSFAVAPHFTSSRQVSDGTATDRLTCMKVACEEARLRELSAEAYERASSADGRSQSDTPGAAPVLTGKVTVPQVAGVRLPATKAFTTAAPYKRSSSMPPPIPVSPPVSPKDPWKKATSSGNLPVRTSPTKTTTVVVATRGSQRSQTPSVGSSVVVAAARGSSRSPTPPAGVWPAPVQPTTVMNGSTAAPAAHRQYSRSPTPPHLPPNGLQ